MPRCAWIALPLLGLFALAGCALPPQAPSPPPAEAEAAPPPPEAAPAAAASPAAFSDQHFVDAALSAGVVQMGIGRLARGKAAAHAVRVLGARLTVDHAIEDARLTAVARHAAITPAPTPARPPPELLIASGSDFDAAFIPIETQALRDLIALFDTAATDAQNPHVKRYARETLPFLQRQLHEVAAVAQQFAAR